MTTPPTEIRSGSLLLRDASETRRLGKALADAAVPGLIVLLDGPLGAGKTTLVQGFTDAIGADRPAASPSFVLAHSYSGGRLRVWHLDLYRLESVTEIADLDLDQYLPPDGVALVEWAERAPDAWPSDMVRVRLEIAGEQRRAGLSGSNRGVAVVRSATASMQAE